MNSSPLLQVSFAADAASATITSDGDQLCAVTMPYEYQIMDSRLTAENDFPLPSGYALAVPERYIELLPALVKRSLADAGLDDNELDAISISALPGGLILLDEEGEAMNEREEFKYDPDAYIKVTAHTSARMEAAQLMQRSNRNGGVLARAYGGIIDARCMIPKLVETVRNVPEIYHASQYVFESVNWFNWMLSGVPTVLAATPDGQAITTARDELDDMLTSIEEDLADAVESHFSAEAVHPGDELGTISDYGQVLTGLPDTVRVIAGAPLEWRSRFNR